MSKPTSFVPPTPRLTLSRRGSFNPLKTRTTSTNKTTPWTLQLGDPQLHLLSAPLLPRLSNGQCRRQNKQRLWRDLACKHCCLPFSQKHQNRVWFIQPIDLVHRSSSSCVSIVLLDWVGLLHCECPPCIKFVSYLHKSLIFIDWLSINFLFHNH